MAWLVGYITRRKLTIDRTKVGADLTDFPVLVKLTSTNFDFSKANANGNDIRFTDSNGTTLLKYERERHDSANSLAEYWVKVPAVSGTVDTDIYIYYRTTDTADGADPTNVWDTNFKGVWHSKDITTSTINDSTTNANDGTKKAANEPIQADGKIGKGQSYDGVDAYVNLPASISNDIVDDITISAWAYSNTLSQSSSYRGLVSDKYVASGDNVEFEIYLEGSSHVLSAGFYDGSWHSLSEAAFPIENWIHVVATYDGHYIRIYKNGAQTAISSDLNRSLPSGTLGWKIGRRHDSGFASNMWNGLIDEACISNTVRSAAWIKADYNSGNDSLLSYGREETLLAGSFLLNFV